MEHKKINKSTVASTVISVAGVIVLLEGLRSLILLKAFLDNLFKLFKKTYQAIPNSLLPNLEMVALYAVIIALALALGIVMLNLTAKRTKASLVAWISAFLTCAGIGVVFLPLVVGDKKNDTEDANDNDAELDVEDEDYAVKKLFELIGTFLMVLSFEAAWLIGKIWLMIPDFVSQSYASLPSNYSFNWVSSIFVFEGLAFLLLRAGWIISHFNWED